MFRSTGGSKLDQVNLERLVNQAYSSIKEYAVHVDLHTLPVLVRK